MRLLVFITLVICVLPACSPSARLADDAVNPRSFEWKLSQMGRTGENYIMVAAHRSDWRHAPENSIPALQRAIAMGADIAEIDLKKTKDGVLVIMHDRTIDRTSDGKGKPEDYTLPEIRKFHLRNGLGRVTEEIIPTFEEYLEIAKDRIVIDVDKGYDYFPDVLRILREKGMIGQTIINVDDNSTLDQVEARYGPVGEDVWLMPIVQCRDSLRARTLINSFKRHKRTIYQPCWSDDRMISDFNFAQLGREGFGIWLNSLWPSLNGGHDDDRAIRPGQADSSWGWLVNKGAAMIQSDRPRN